METVVDLLSSHPKTATEIYTESGQKEHSSPGIELILFKQNTMSNSNEFLFTQDSRPITLCAAPTIAPRTKNGEK
jgi:hypothetical protein